MENCASNELGPCHAKWPPESRVISVKGYLEHQDNLRKLGFSTSKNVQGYRGIRG